MSRSRNYNRDMSRRKALRKRRISREVYHFDYYNNLHQYSDNKIHCSCPICRCKTRNKGAKRRTGSFDPSINFKHSELKKIKELKEWDELL